MSRQTDKPTVTARLATGAMAHRRLVRQVRKELTRQPGKQAPKYI